MIGNSFEAWSVFVSMYLGAELEEVRLIHISGSLFYGISEDIYEVELRGQKIGRWLKITGGSFPHVEFDPYPKFDSLYTYFYRSIL